MRTALLSCQDQLPDGTLRGFARLGGRTLLSWQIELAHDLGCDRFVCLTEAKTDAFTKIREQIEQFGGEFHTISGPMPLAALLTADDELVVIADGLVPDREETVELLKDRRGVLALPDEPGVAAGFERIDAQHAWGGVFVARGQIGEQLAQMPPDSDTVSLLLRLALQSGTKLLNLDAAMLDDGRWVLIRQGTEQKQREQALLQSSLEEGSWWDPSKAISLRFAKSFAPDRLETGITITAVLSALGAIGTATAGYFQITTWGLAALAFTIIANDARVGLLRLRNRLLGREPKTGDKWLKLATDLALVALLAWPFDLTNAFASLFLPLVTIGLIRIGAVICRSPFDTVLEGRGLLVLGLAIAHQFLIGEQFLQVLILLVLSITLFFQGKSKITRA